MKDTHTISSAVSIHGISSMKLAEVRRILDAASASEHESMTIVDVMRARFIRGRLNALAKLTDALIPVRDGEEAMITAVSAALSFRDEQREVSNLPDSELQSLSWMDESQEKGARAVALLARALWLAERDGAGAAEGQSGLRFVARFLILAGASLGPKGCTIDGWNGLFRSVRKIDDSGPSTIDGRLEFALIDSLISMSWLARLRFLYLKTQKEAQKESEAREAGDAGDTGGTRVSAIPTGEVIVTPVIIRRTLDGMVTSLHRFTAGGVA